MKRLVFASALAAMLLSMSGCDSTRAWFASLQKKAPSPSASPPSDAKKQPAATPVPVKSEPEALPLAVRRADYAITTMQLDRAEEILDGEVGPDAARARARLAIYRADCEGALAHLASQSAQAAKGAPQLLDLATRCKGATAGAVIIEDKKNGVWLRLQDEADRALVEILTDVAVQARAALEKDLDVELPRPLKIDLVRDLFSLSAVCGLPLEAAETTGTVAVARWGRVTMISPRAMRRGFPWADTLAHEITHLLISRATADYAPLWLQEGIAKREEHRWREKQAFDDAYDFSERAYQAQVQGNSVGVNQIGPSIAMLPSAEAASIAFAEVTSFMEYWIDKNGPHSLGFLLRDIGASRDAEAAMRSVSGHSVGDWELLWRKDLASRFDEVDESVDELQVDDLLGHRALGRSLRLTELLATNGEHGAAAELSSPDLDRAPHSAALRYLIARSALLSEREDADELLGTIDDVDDAHAGWLALRAGRLQKEASSPQAQAFLKQATGLDPLLPEVVCAGQPWVGKETTPEVDVGSPEGFDEELCAHARSLVVRGSR